MSTFTEEFEAADNDNMDDIKQRVKSWQESYLGKDYTLEIKTERNIVLTKAKHDMKICCYPCIIIIISAFGLVMIPMLSYQAAMTIVLAYVVFIMAVEVIAVAWFCLKPAKSEYNITFSQETPIRIRVYAVGELDKSAHEYSGLKNSIQSNNRETGPGLAY